MKAADLQRYLLLAAIAALSLMLLVEWSRFQEAREEQQQQQRAALLAQSTAETPVETPDTESAAPSVPTTGDSHESSDVPSITPSDTPESTPSAPATPPGRLMTVTTDVLKLRIDRKGGEIVYAALLDHKEDQDKDQPFVLLEQTPFRTYIAQSGLAGAPDMPGVDNSGGKPLFQVNRSRVTLGRDQDRLSVTLSHRTDAGVTLLKRFHLKRGDHLITVEYTVDNQSQSPWAGRFYGQLKRDNSEDPTADSGRIGIQPFLGVATTTPEERFSKTAFKKLADNPVQHQTADSWVAIIQHYFLSAWVPGDDRPWQIEAQKNTHGDNLARIISPPLRVNPGQQRQISAQLFVGPKDQYRLREIAPHLDLSVDYGWLWWIAQPLFWLLNKLHGLLGNWGMAIISLTLIIKLAFFRLSAASYRSMANMRRVQPKLEALKSQYGDDRQKMSQAMMELYRKEKINPLGGCLPILLQMPVFIALYWVLLESVELRHAPFIGYITDLSARDPYFILPLIMGASMFLQQKLNPPPPDPTQAKLLQWMPVAFTVFFLWFPAGLVLYWVVNNLLSIAQQWVITRRITREA